MNKELYLSYRNAYKDWINYEKVLHKMADLLTYCGQCLSTKESIEALSYIREYYKEFVDDKDVIYRKYRRSMRDFQKECRHEIVVKNHSLKCAVCDLKKLSSDYIDKSMVYIDLTSSIFMEQLSEFVCEVIEMLVLNDKNIAYFFEEEFNKKIDEFAKSVMEKYPHIEDDEIYGKVRRLAK